MGFLGYNKNINIEQQGFTPLEVQNNFLPQNQEAEVQKKREINKILLFVFLGLMAVAGLLFVVYKSFYVKPAGEQELIPTLTPAPTVFEPTVTPVPTKKAVVPTKIPTKIIAPTSTPVPPTATPVANSPNELRCEVSTSPMAGPAPLEVTLAYTVLNIGSDAYVTGVQWDFNGDGNWDTDLNINTGRVNYTYSTVGVYTVRLKTQLSDGRITECSASVAVQPH